MSEKTNFNVIEKTKTDDVSYIIQYINTIVNNLIIKDFARNVE